jgi:two-component system chemotaxis sensor kinase CheA
MDKTEILKKLMGTFLEELDEHVRSFNQNLLALEKELPADERAERFKTLFRTAHSLKGAARSVSIPLIEGACHRVEELLSRVRAGQLTFSADLFALLFSTIDAIEEAGMRLREQQDLAGAPLAAILPRLESAVSGGPPSPPEPAKHLPVPAAASVPAAKPAARGTGPAAAVPASIECTPAPAAAVPPAPRSPVSEPAPETAAGSASVRVSAEKLDELLARVGELMITQRRVEERVSDLAALQDFVAQWKAEWKRVELAFAREPGGVLAPASAGGVQTVTLPTALPRRTSLILRQAGENLRRMEKSLERLTATLRGDLRLLDQATRPLDDSVRRVRMLPFAEACAGLDRMVRDLAQATNKEAALRIEGGAIELDRSILEGLKDPLRHLVRNALDHGVEAPDQRAGAGKPRQALLTVTAALRGAQVEVTVGDDGRGLDREAIRAKARRGGLPEPQEERELLGLIFLPGFSTASIITDVSGRGVGLDVVKDRVEALHGTVDLSTAAGQGTRFTLSVPLTLTTLRAVLVRAGGATFAIAGTNVHKLLHVHGGAIRSLAGPEVVTCDGVPVPIASLADVLRPQTRSAAAVDRRRILIVASGTTRMAFIVDEFLREQEILIKNLGARVRRTPLVVGAAVLPAGNIALVLNAANLIRAALAQGAPLARPAVAPLPSAAPARKRLLVVEDSITTRALIKSILEAAGYVVTTAADGQAGWHALQEQAVDLVVSDVEMPVMDGFELTAAIRAARPFASLPVILVTARESEQDKARGIEVGADAYLEKSAFDQRSLLETIAQLL